MLSEDRYIRSSITGTLYTPVPKGLLHFILHLGDLGKLLFPGGSDSLHSLSLFVLQRGLQLLHLVLGNLDLNTEIWNSQTTQ